MADDRVSTQVTDSDAKVTIGIPTFNRANFLREAIAGVLAQSYRDFKLVVCDNASDDDTRDVVMSFADPRITYLRSDENIGMVANFNRVIEIADTEFLMLLPDDDLIYPDYLSRTVQVLESFPRVGVAHTAFDVVAGASRFIERSKTLVKGDEDVTFESGHDFIERSMRENWTVCWSTALFRTSAIAGDGLREEEEPLSDFPLLMRIACDWDFACVQRTLGAHRLHAETATAALGSYSGAGYILFDNQPQVLHAHRMRLLDDPSRHFESEPRWRALAEASYRQATVRALAARAGLDESWTSTWIELAGVLRQDPRTVFVPDTWRLVLAQLGGRSAKRFVRSLKTRIVRADLPAS